MDRTPIDQYVCLDEIKYICIDSPWKKQIVIMPFPMKGVTCGHSVAGQSVLYAVKHFIVYGVNSTLVCVIEFNEHEFSTLTTAFIQLPDMTGLANRLLIPLDGMDTGQSVADRCRFVVPICFQQDVLQEHT
jgi:hypothetical protein